MPEHTHIHTFTFIYIDLHLAAMCNLKYKFLKVTTRFRRLAMSGGDETVLVVGSRKHVYLIFRHDDGNREQSPSEADSLVEIHVINQRQWLMFKQNATIMTKHHFQQILQPIT
jgi:hypothetical protein